MPPLTFLLSCTVARRHTQVVYLTLRLYDYELMGHSSVIRRLRIFVLRLDAEEVIFVTDEISVVPP